MKTRTVNVFSYLWQSVKTRWNGFFEHPTDEAGKFLLPRAIYEDFRTLNEVISCVGPAAWNQWDETSKLYWKSCVPRMRMLIENAKVTEE